MNIIFKSMKVLVNNVLVWSIVFVYFFVFILPANLYAESLPESEIKALSEYPNWVASAQNCDPGSASIGADISEIVSKNSLHSALIKEVGGSIVASHGANLDPATPASTMKLVIVDTVLKSNVDINKNVRFGSDVYYDGQNDLGGSSTTIKNALVKTMKVSSNTGANVLVKQLGGPEGFSGKATAAGYKNTLMRGYYSSASRSINDSSIADQVSAMESIFSSEGAGYKAVQDALKTANNQYGIADVKAVKWGGTSTVTSSVAMFEFSDKKYVIGAYINEDMAIGGAKIKQAFADMVEVAKSPSGGTGASSGCCTAGSFSESGDNLKDIFGFLVSKGLSDVQAAGVVGNIVHESGGEPRKIQGGALSDDPNAAGSGGYGIVQFTPGKKLLDILAATKRTNEPINGKPSALLTQLEALWKQLSGGVKVGGETKWNESAALKDLKAQTDIKEAVLAFQGNTKVGGKYGGYERPADQAGSVPDRVAAAKLALKDYAGGGGAGGSSCGGAVSGDLIGTIKNYAWPTYHASPYIKMMPAYKSAVNKAKAEGRYVGGTHSPGVDCGGFITTAMIDSGYEPGYNYESKHSKGAGTTIQQEAWLKSNWEKVSVSSTGDLRPGDVAINTTHTFMFVGKVGGFSSNIASASWSSTVGNGRAPMAGKENPIDSSYTWYRKKG